MGQQAVRPLRRGYPSPFPSSLEARRPQIAYAGGVLDFAFWARAAAEAADQLWRRLEHRPTNQRVKNPEDGRDAPKKPQIDLK